MGGFPVRNRILLDTNCCVTCFNHPWVRSIIREESTTKGRCDYCGHKRRLLPIRHLADYFHNLAEMYVESGDGDSLVFLVQDEWDVFSEWLYESGRAAELLEDILNSDWDDDSGEPPISASDAYRRREVLPELESWEQFCFDVKEDPEAQPEFGEFFDVHLEYAENILPAETVLYRARAGWSAVVDGRRQPYRGADIGAPPPERAAASRANRQGRPVLYGSEDEETAVPEVRPARGFWVSTCRVRLLRDTKVLDLVDGIPEPNPFTDETLAWSVQFAELLYSFADALSTPLARSDDVDDYLPSQKLCEYLEQEGYTAVRYPSAMHDAGVNIVLFDPGAVEILDSRLVEVTSVEVKFHGRASA